MGNRAPSPRCCGKPARWRSSLRAVPSRTTSGSGCRCVCVWPVSAAQSCFKPVQSEIQDLVPEALPVIQCPCQHICATLRPPPSPPRHMALERTALAEDSQMLAKGAGLHQVVVLILIGKYPIPMQGIEREYEELDTVWFMAGSLFNKYPYDTPSVAFSFKLFRQVRCSTNARLSLSASLLGWHTTMLRNSVQPWLLPMLQHRKAAHQGRCACCDPQLSVGTLSGRAHPRRVLPPPAAGICGGAGQRGAPAGRAAQPALCARAAGTAASRLQPHRQGEPTRAPFLKSLSLPSYIPAGSRTPPSEQCSAQ